MRLFAGIELPPDARAVFANVQERLRDAGLDARYDPPENLHLTLAFLGNVEDERLGEISQALAGAAQRSAPFAMTFDRLGAFPHERRPRIVWIGPRAQPAQFRELAAAVRSEFAGLGFSFEDDAVAHVTIARIKGGGTHPVPLLEPARTQIEVARIALFESLSDGSATRYEIRARAPLGSGSPA